MSIDPRYQARVLAEHPSSIPRIQLEALQALEPHLRDALESQMPTLQADVLDALKALLAGAHLTLAQRQALVEPLQAHLAALVAAEDAEAGPRLMAVQ